MAKRKHIELFAGCGGMALGMEAAKFQLYFANELSPMAGQTFAYNIFNEDLEQLAKKNESPNHTFWVSSDFNRKDLRKRLIENPFNKDKKINSDLELLSDLSNKLLIGDINQLIEFLNKNAKLKKQLKSLDIDLLSGGPPCQGFSMAGQRIKDDSKNKLPWSFAEFSSIIKPKVVLLENVEGITAPFEQDGKKYYAWLEISKAFSLKGFVPVCMMLNSKYFGVPQNRPRFILLGFREDIFKKIQKIERNRLKKTILTYSYEFYHKVNSQNDIENIEQGDFDYYDIEKWKGFFDGDLFPKIKTDYKKFISSKDAVDDLKNASRKYKINKLDSDYVKNLNTIFQRPIWAINDLLENHDERKHSEIVRDRFRLYQIISQFQNGMQSNAYKLIAGRELRGSEERILLQEFTKYKFRNNQEINNIDEVREYIANRATNKQSQKALIAKEPAPAQLTIPDDICHYKETRTFTVREMARFQSFPDWFIFRSKVTTGGKHRKFEVPQYTQVGNAVPPLLAKALGDSIRKILNLIKE